MSLVEFPFWAANSYDGLSTLLLEATARIKFVHGAGLAPVRSIYRLHDGALSLITDLDALRYAFDLTRIFLTHFFKALLQIATGLVAHRR
jgi:hypothetical protein